MSSRQLFTKQLNKLPPPGEYFQDEDLMDYTETKSKPNFTEMKETFLFDSTMAAGEPGNSSLLRSHGSTFKRPDRKSKIRKSYIENLSISIAPDEISYLCDLSATGMTTACVIPVNDLFREFHKICLTFSSTVSVFDAIQSFINECEAVIDLSCTNGTLCDTDGNDLSWLVNEKNTWRLILALYKDRALFNEDSMSDIPMGEPHPLSEKEIVDYFYQMNRSVREAQLVVDWLEHNARDEWKLLHQEEMAFFTDKTVAWENTLFQLQNNRIPYESSREIVRSLDPDAPRREGRPLHDLDADDEKRLLKQVFAEIRKGSITKAQEICIHCGQAWRAATLDGWRLFHDPNYTSHDNRSKLPIEGNLHRDIWKICAWKMCEDPAVPLEDKAVMGILCGHLPSILPYCSSWEDLLWAHTKVSIDVAAEQNIRDNSLKSFLPLPPQYWNHERKLEDILQEIGSSSEGRTPIRVIQELLIIGLTSELLSRCSTWVESKCQPQFLRFLAHVVLVLRMIGYSEPEHLGDDIIKAYIKSMFDDPDPELIAFYCTKLTEEDQVELFSLYLETIDDSTERQICLQAAEKFDLKTSQITERVVQRVRNEESQIPDGSGPELAQEITDEDEKKISALEWMMFYEQQRAEALWETNAIVRNFIMHNKLVAARRALIKVPSDSIEIVLIQNNCTIDEEEAVRTSKLPAKVNSAIKEHLCLTSYVDAHESFSYWFHQFHNTKPTPPSKPTNSNDFTESIAYEHKEKRYNDELDRWKSTMLHQTKRLQKQLNNIIVFPGGWLVDNFVQEEPRKSHLERLQSRCIPEICLLLHKVLNQMEMYSDAMDLMVLLMDESTKYYKVFNRQQMSEFLLKMMDTCKAILGNDGNPFGNREESDDVVQLLRIDRSRGNEDSKYIPSGEGIRALANHLLSQRWKIDKSELEPYNNTPSHKESDDEEEDEDRESQETLGLSISKTINDKIVNSKDDFVRIDPEMAEVYDELLSKKNKLGLDEY